MRNNEIELLAECSEMARNNGKTLVAVTGGIGSGKSTAIGILSSFGYPVFGADETYRELLRDEEFVSLVSGKVGVKPIEREGKIFLDRKAISELVFRDEKAKEKLESVTHPAIMRKMLQNASAATGSLVFCEVPLLYEGGYRDLFDFVFLVKRPDRARFAAVVSRDGRTEEQARKIASRQFDYEGFKGDERTFVIENDGDVPQFAEKIATCVNYIKTEKLITEKDK